VRGPSPRVETLVSVLHQEEVVGELPTAQRDWYFDPARLFEAIPRHNVRLDLLVSFFRNVDSSWFSCCLGATRQVDGVAEEAVPRHSVADHSGNNFTGVNPDCDPLNKIQYI
jgi:hypothetical protein